MVKQGLKNVLIIFMAFLIVSTGIIGNVTEIPVYADNENNEENNDDENNESEDDDEEDEHIDLSKVLSEEGNMYGFGDKDNGSEARSVLEDASSYDIRMQFMVTYNFLVDDFGEIAPNSNYSQIFEGKGKKDLDFKLNTDPIDILSNASPDAKDDPHDEDDGEEKSDEEKEEMKDEKELRHKLAKELAKRQTINVINAYGTSKEDRETVKKERLKKKAKENYYEGYNLDYYGSLESKKDYETNGETSDEAKEYLEERYTALFEKALESEDLEKDMKGKDLAKVVESVTEINVVQLIANDYREENGLEKLKNLGGFDKNSYTGINGIIHYDDDALNGTNGETGFLRKDMESAQGVMGWEDYIKSGVGLRFNAGKKGNLEESDVDILLDIFPEYSYVASYKKTDFKLKKEDTGNMDLGALSLHVGDWERALNEVNGAVEGNVEKVFKGSLEKYADKDDSDLNKAFKEMKEKGKDDKKHTDKMRQGDSILSWVKISPNFRNLKEDDEQKLTEFMEDSKEKLTEDNGTVYVKEGEDELPRTIQTRDLMNSDDPGKLLIAGGKNKVGYQIGKDEEFQSGGVNISRYVGTRMEEKWIFKDKPKKSTRGEDRFNVSVAKNIFANNKDLKLNIDSKSNDIIGIDNYGNIIDSTEGTILIPYWQNDTVGRFGHDGEEAWASNPIYRNKKVSKTNLDEVISDNLGKIKENDVTKDDIKKSFKEELDSDVYSQFEDKIPSTPGDIKDDLKGLQESLIGEDDKVDEDAVIWLALAITSGTYEDVKSWNESLKDAGKKGKEMYVFIDEGRDSSAGGDDSNKSKFEDYTDADLRERIMMILDYGFYEVLRLTVASLIVNIYNTGFIHYTMSSVFHTTTIADTDVYEDLLVIFSTLLASIVGAYVLWMGLQVFRQQMRMMDVVKQFLLITLIILIPTMIYSPLIDLTINKPTPFFLGKNMEQTMILDHHVHQVEKEREESDDDDAYVFLFNGSQELRDKTQDYIIKFYTTTHRKGFDIEDVDYDDLSWTDRIKLSNAEKTGGWDKRDVESVRVSVYDLFDWVTAKVDKKEGEGKTDLELFEWLEEEHPDKYENVSQYTEISFDPQKENEDLGRLKKEDVDAEEIKASEMLERLYESSSSRSSGGSALKDRIINMENVSNVVKSTDKTEETIDKEEVDSLIRDFSLTSQGREIAFGTAPIESDKVEKPEESTPNISQKTVQTWERISDQKLIIPEGDYMNLESVIEDVNPDIGDPRQTPNDKIVYNVNKRVISDYINVQSQVREAVGSDIGKSEFMAVTLNEFFSLNSELDIPMYPTKIEPDSISLDSFARMIYVPLHEYKQTDNKDLNNLAEYLSLRDNPFMLLLLFVPALIALVIWGTFYFVIFGFLLLLVSVATFFWQYIVRRDMQNKSWLGTVWIIIRLALAKLGLLALWFGMAYGMNYMYNRFGGFTYAYTYVHSLIIIVYIYFCIKKVFLKTLQQVRENPSELGGSKMLSDFKDTVGKFRNGKLFNRGNPSSKGTNEKSVEKTLDNEGSEGAISTGTLGNIGTNLRAIRDKFKGSSQGEVDEISNAIDPLGNRMSRRFPKLTKGVSGESRKEMLGDYDAIGSAEGIGITSSEMLGNMAATGTAGQVLSSTAGGAQITKMAVGTAENASRLASHLTSKGVKAWDDGEGNVYYNSQGVDQDSKEVRKGLYGGLLEEYYDEIDEGTSIKEQSEDNVLPYSQTEDGNLSIDVGDKGISTSNVDAILSSSKFRDSFVLESSPVKGMNGEYIQGSLVVKPRNGVDAHESVSQMFTADSRMRQDRGEQERGEVEQDQSVTLEGLQDYQEVERYIKSGMSLQGNKIVYDSSNSKHIKSVSKLKKKIESQNESKYEDKLDFMTNMASHVAYGDGSGVDIEYSNTGKDKEVRQFAKQKDLVGDKVESKVYAGEGAERITKNIKEARSLINMDNESINEYHNKRDELFKHGESVFIGEDENYEKGFNKLAKTAKKAGGNKDLIEGRVKEYKNLGNQFNNAEITETEYNREVEALYSDLQLDLQEDGSYSKVLAKEVRSEKAPQEFKDSFNNYVKSKRNLEDNGVSSEMVERFDSAEFSNMMETLDNIDDIEDNGDGTVNIKSDQSLNEEDTERIIEKMRGIQIGKGDKKDKKPKEKVDEYFVEDDKEDSKKES